MVVKVARFTDKIDGVGHFGKFLNFFGPDAFPMERAETVVAAEKLPDFFALETCFFVELSVVI